MSTTTYKPLPSPFDRNCLSGKVAVVTGGGSGIGYSITEQLLQHGCSVVIVGRRLSFLKSAAATLTESCCRNNGMQQQQVLYHTCDVRDPQACNAVIQFVIQKFGRLHILVNGAAGNFLVEAKDLKPKGFKTVIEIDTLGTYNMSYAAYPFLKNDKKTSCIINISATLQYGATWFQIHVSAAKSAIDSMTRSLALEWGNDGIRVNGIAPGPIADTPGMTKLAPSSDGDGKEMAEEMIKEGIPLQRMGRGFDIAMAVIFLSCDATGSYITGDTLIVDGGHWLYKPPMIPRELVAELSRKVEKKSRDMKPNASSSSSAIVSKL